MDLILSPGRVVNHDRSGLLPIRKCLSSKNTVFSYYAPFWANSFLRCNHKRLFFLKMLFITHAYLKFTFTDFVNCSIWIYNFFCMHNTTRLKYSRILDVLPSSWRPLSRDALLHRMDVLFRGSPILSRFLLLLSDFMLMEIKIQKCQLILNVY